MKIKATQTETFDLWALATITDMTREDLKKETRVFYAISPIAVGHDCLFYIADHSVLIFDKQYKLSLIISSYF